MSDPDLSADHPGPNPKLAQHHVATICFQTTEVPVPGELTYVLYNIFNKLLYYYFSGNNLSVNFKQRITGSLPSKLGQM